VSTAPPLRSSTGTALRRCRLLDRCHCPAVGPPAGWSRSRPTSALRPGRTDIPPTRPPRRARTTRRCRIRRGPGGWRCPPGDRIGLVPVDEHARQLDRPSDQRHRHGDRGDEVRSTASRARRLSTPAKPSDSGPPSSRSPSVRTQLLRRRFGLARRTAAALADLCARPATTRLKPTAPVTSLIIDPIVAFHVIRNFARLARETALMSVPARLRPHLVQLHQPGNGPATSWAIKDGTRSVKGEVVRHRLPRRHQRRAEDPAPHVGLHQRHRRDRRPAGCRSVLHLLQKDAHKQFVPLQTCLGTQDGLNEYLRHTGSGMFAVPTGPAGPGDWWGKTLFT
jgi:Dyp-type peroxidase family